MMSRLVEKSVSKHEAFINDVLNEDIRRIEFRLHHANAEINSLILQQQALNEFTSREMQSDGLHTQVDIGCNFYLDGVVSDTSTMLMNVGLNYFLEVSADEANKYLDLRKKAFEKKVEELKDQSTKTYAHIEHMLVHNGELQNKVE